MTWWREPVSARTWREYGYMLAGTLLGLPTFALALLGLTLVPLSLLTVGLPFLVGVLWVARRSVRWFRAPARAILGWEWPDPPPVPLLRLIRDPHAWRALAYCFLTFPVKLSAAYVGGWVVFAGTVLVTYPLWFAVGHPDDGWLAVSSWPGTWWLAVQGAVALLAFPWFVRVLVLLDRWLAYGLLAPSGSQRRIAALEAGRSALQRDAVALMRRVERDLHDGTQARLVTLGVTLGRIERRSDDPAAVRDLVDDARGTVTEALAELRDIVRGLHPPALDDGLEVALGTLAGRSAVPVEVDVRLSRRPDDATASAIYFTATELLTNVARHARATRARIDLRDDPRWLTLTVTDDGRGGAGRAGAGTETGGTGLDGLARRAAALDGSLTVQSPPGGPTVVTMLIPGA